MNHPLACLLLAVLSAGTAPAALAHGNDAARTDPAQLLARQRAPLGYPSPGPADRVVEIGAQTRYLNVARHETVRINIDGNSIIWTFDTLGMPTFPLSKIVPEAKGVIVYVGESVIYDGD